MFNKANQIIIEIAEKYGFEKDALMAKGRSKTLILARKEAMRRIRSETSLSLPEMGKLFGKDHTTILHHLQT